jgi:hypothetical protein
MIATSALAIRRGRASGTNTTRPTIVAAIAPRE